MVAMQFGRVDEYKESKEDFESYMERFEQWLLANDIANEKKEIQDFKIQGFIRHKLYTEYNQQWNVSQVHSMDSAIICNTTQDIYINIGIKKE